MNKTVLALSMGMAVVSQTALAVELQSGDNLTIEEGSYFDFGGFGNQSSIVGENGLTVGLALGDTGTGSHGGPPNAGDIGAVTKPWLFFCNTGYDYMSATNGSGLFGGDTEAGVDMSGWTATWNGTPAILLGGCSLGDPANNGGFSGCDEDRDGVDDYFNTGVGTFSWSGVYGDNYTITYTTHIPVGDPSGFGKAPYDLFLTGRVLKAGAPLPPTQAVVINLENGTVYECNEGGSAVFASANVFTTDTNDVVSIDWLVNGEPVASGESVEVFVPLGDNELMVKVSTLESGSVSNTRNIQVRDTQSPIIEADFVNSWSGRKVSRFTGRVRSGMKSGRFTILYSATDACDDSPQVEATLGVDVASGDTMRLSHGSGKLVLRGDLLSDSVVLNVTATDQSGRRAVLRKILER